jgi:archaellum component FlaC
VSTQEHILERLRRLEEKIEALQLLVELVLIEIRPPREKFHPTADITVRPCTH